MAYELYEQMVKNAKKCYEQGIISNPNFIKEIEEVYSKAKAWNELKEDYKRNYIQARKEGKGVVDMQHYGAVIYAMDCYDGKSEFSNLLSDLEDEK